MPPIPADTSCLVVVTFPVVVVVGVPGGGGGGAGSEVANDLGGVALLLTINLTLSLLLTDALFKNLISASVGCPDGHPVPCLEGLYCLLLLGILLPHTAPTPNAMATIPGKAAIINCQSLALLSFISSFRFSNCCSINAIRVKIGGEPLPSITILLSLAKSCF